MGGWNEDDERSEEPTRRDDDGTRVILSALRYQPRMLVTFHYSPHSASCWSLLRSTFRYAPLVLRSEPTEA